MKAQYNTSHRSWQECIARKFIKGPVTVRGYRFLNTDEFILFGDTTDYEGNVRYFVLHRATDFRYPIKVWYKYQPYSFKKLVTSNYEEYRDYINYQSELAEGSYLDKIDHLTIKKLTNGGRV